MSQTVQNIKAADIMTRRLVTLSPEMDVFKAIDMLARNHFSGAPVIDKNRTLLGMFTEKSCLEVLVDAACEGLPTNQVGAFMSEPAHTICETTTMLEMAQVFLNKRTRRLPVLKDRKLVGQVSRRDLIGSVSKIIKKTSDYQKTLLYLSALREFEDAPVT